MLSPQARLITGSTQKMSNLNKSMAEQGFQVPCFKVIAGGKRSHVQHLCPLHMSTIPGLIMHIFHKHVHPNKRMCRARVSVTMFQSHSGRSTVMCTEFVSAPHTRSDSENIFTNITT